MNLYVQIKLIPYGSICSNESDYLWIYMFKWKCFPHNVCVHLSTCVSAYVIPENRPGVWSFSTKRISPSHTHLLVMKSLTTHKLYKAWKKFHVLCRTPLLAEDTSSLNKDFTGRLQKKTWMAPSEILRIGQKFPSHGTKNTSTHKQGKCIISLPKWVSMMMN